MYLTWPLPVTLLRVYLDFFACPKSGLIVRWCSFVQDTVWIVYIIKAVPDKKVIPNM